MCGVVGIARTAGSAPPSPDLVRRMASAIVHRGPDDEGFHASERAVIGMRRLSIIDLAGGHQPIANEDETLWLVCNGEIYNFRELRTELIARGHRFRTGSDVEVLLHLYEEHGDRFLEHVSGMFAAALWDERRKRLIVARDRLGIKPVYYIEARGSLAFASEMKSLLEIPGVDRELDRDALREYLTLGYTVAPRTLFRSIRKLPPASVLVWDESGLKIQTYWEIPDTVRSDLDSDAWVEIIRTELDRAVREHMVSDVPIGAFLSGGLDSSAVVALMSRYSDRPVNTYSIGYVGKGAASYYNELSYAATVARRFATHHTEIPVEPDVATLLPKLLWHVEEPISDSAIITTFLVSELAAKSVKVILSGVGGDELFAGYTRYLGEHYGRRYRLLPTWMRRGIIQPLARRLPAGRQSRLMDLARYARKFIDSSELSWSGQYRSYMEILAREQADALLRGASGVAEDGFERIAREQSSPDSLLRLLRLDARTQLSEDLLLLTDKITMAASIECRVPFLDHRLVEIAGGIPESIKMRGGEPKHILRRALQGIVPQEILERGKRGFGAPVGSWLKAELKPLLEELLHPDVVAARGLLSPETVRALIRDHDAAREDYSDLLLVLVNLEIWCRLFLDRRSVADVSASLTGLAEVA
ncbi:MAG TPA: asparagine synthase (glutamine-hydrolyzing) [Steroidobacteraceae bacterium]|nr:asparagine synthase (glutamine-hydrolyzing) [Steroidobacteraceae bacterium]